MIFRTTSVIFCAISQTMAGDYQVTVEYSLPPLNTAQTMTLNGTGSLTDPESGPSILTIHLGSQNINYFPGLIFGSFNNINLTYTGATGQITGDWDVTNPFNPAGNGPVLIPLNGGGDISSWNQVVPFTGGSSSGEFDDPDGELSILSWSIEDLDGPDNPPTGEPYIQISSNVVYELSGSPLFAGQLPSTSIAAYEYPPGPNEWQPQGFSWSGWDANGCSFQANEGSESYEYFDGYGGSDFFQYTSSLTFEVRFLVTEPLLWNTTGNYGYELRNLRSDTSTAGVLSELNGTILAPGNYLLMLLDGGFGDPYESINQYGCAWDCVQCDCTDCCPEEFYQETYSGYLVSGSYTLEPAPAACPADLNNDGSVDFSDLVQLISKWGNCPNCPEDINSDGEVNFTDLLQITSTWGPC